MLFDGVSPVMAGDGHNRRDNALFGKAGTDQCFVIPTSTASPTEQFSRSPDLPLTDLQRRDGSNVVCESSCSAVGCAGRVASPGPNVADGT
jgi:hypothetical protein